MIDEFIGLIITDYNRLRLPMYNNYMFKKHLNIFLSVIATLSMSFTLGVAEAEEAIIRPIVFPVNGPSSFRDDFGDPRESGTREHLGIDIAADKMTPVVSAVDGRVVYVVSPEASWGYSVSIQDSEGYTYRYLHLNNDTPGTDDGQGGETNAYAPGIRRGATVTKGQHIGWVGDSGNAEHTISHLHFEIRNPDRTPINPYPSLVEAARTSLFSASIRVGTFSGITHPSDTETPIDGTEYYFTEDLLLGSRGPAVSALQSRLKNMGYFTSYITDYFGPITQAALIKYQAAKSIAQTGILDAITRSILNVGVTPPVNGTGITTSLPPSTSPYIFTQNLSIGSSGTAVTELQKRLKALGHFAYLPTGYFGSLTETAVMRYQTSVAIAPTGVVSEMTRAALNGGVANPVPPTQVPGEPYVLTQNLSVGSSGEEVRQLQMILRFFGYFKNILATGYFGSITKTEVINFQKAKGLTPTGVVERITRAFLNGCTSNTGYSVRTGKSCVGTLVLPPGCTSLAGYSTLTGQACGTSLLPGCKTNTGYSATTGQACWNI